MAPVFKPVEYYTTKFYEKGKETKRFSELTEDDIKELKLKVKTDIHANGVKVTGSKDDMQNVINMVTTNQAKYKTPIQITNYNEEK